MKTKLKKGDNVVIIAGKDKGKEGKITLIDRKNGKVVVLYKERAFVGSQLAITKDVSLKEKYLQNVKTFPLKAVVEASVGNNLKLILNGKEFYSDFIVKIITIFF